MISLRPLGLGAAVVVLSLTGGVARADTMADTLVRHAPTPGDDIALLLLSPTQDGG